MTDSSSSSQGTAWETSNWASGFTIQHQHNIGPFNWTGLPTEVKEQVLQFCVCDPRDEKDLAQQERRHRAHARSGFGASHDLGPYEIVGRLKGCSSFIKVSRQVRNLVLRLCFIGRRCQAEMSGFAIAAMTYRKLDSNVRRLDRHYQFIEPNGIPVDDQTAVLAEAYRCYPRIYPELKQYATFKHGIQTVQIEMDFKEYMHFFQVKVGSFEQYLDSKALSHRIFDQMPNLRNIIIHLPGKPKSGWTDNYWQSGPQIFQGDSPCPRNLHRIIYERAAQVSAPYKNICMVSFMDENEEQRCCKALAAARKQVQFTEEDYKELYTDCGGGVQLD